MGGGGRIVLDRGQKTNVGMLTLVLLFSARVRSTITRVTCGHWDAYCMKWLAGRKRLKDPTYQHWLTRL